MPPHASASRSTTPPRRGKPAISPRPAASSNRTVDVAVVGVGAAGLVAAIACAQAGFTVALVGPMTARPDGRTVALLDGSVAFLTRLGLWEGLASEAAPLATMRLIDDTGSLFRTPPVEFHSGEIGLDVFGYNIENTRLISLLYKQAKTLNQVTHREAAVTALDSGNRAARLTLADGGTVAARLVVAADGRNSFLRQALDIPTQSWMYPQHAVTAILAHDRPHRDASTEFHTREGPCTLVPLPGQRSSLVWMMAPEKAERILILNDNAFAEAVESQAHSMLGRMRVDGPRGAVPMGGLSVSRLAERRVALVGEAAHAFPPIGAQGLNLGLRDVAALVEAASSHRDDPGGDAALEAYIRARRTDVAMRTHGVDWLNRSLIAPYLPVDFARGLGLTLLDTLPPLRRFAMRLGLGARA